MTASEALAEIERLGEGLEPALIAYVNAHTLNLASGDDALRRILAEEAALVLNDGIGLTIAGRLHRAPFPENLNGSDLNPRIAELCARKGWSLYLLGARPGVASMAAERLTERFAGLEIAGARDGYFPPGDSAGVAAEIRATGADAVMVALGNPLQEKWLAEHLEATGARLGVGVGAFFDFTAGHVRRAPAWMNKVGLEWVHRLAVEPARLWRRYLVGNPLFLYRVAAERARRRRSAAV